MYKLGKKVKSNFILPFSLPFQLACIGFPVKWIFFFWFNGNIVILEPIQETARVTTIAPKITIPSTINYLHKTRTRNLIFGLIGALYLFNPKKGLPPVR